MVPYYLPRIVAYLAETDFESLREAVEAVCPTPPLLDRPETPEDLQIQIRRAPLHLLVVDQSLADAPRTKSQARHESLPPILIALTGEEDAEATSRLVEAGADLVLRKPLTAGALQTALRSSLRRIRAEQEALDGERRRTFSATVATVSHEINNALCTILGHTALLEDVLFKGRRVMDTDDIRETLRTLTRQGRRIARVVKSLQKIRRPEMTPYMGSSLMVLLPPEPEMLPSEPDETAGQTSAGSA